MTSLPEATLVAGRGIAGDRYFAGAGEFSPAVQDPDHELTLIAIEEVERLNQVAGLSLLPGDLRRNLVTRGVALNDLVGVEFSVGEVALKGIRLCEPCRSLAARTHPSVVRHLVHRGGLRAGILRGGRVRVGDAIGPAGSGPVRGA
jgi:MOSC domain-containing protein YiiM